MQSCTSLRKQMRPTCNNQKRMDRHTRRAERESDEKDMDIEIERERSRETRDRSIGQRCSGQGPARAWSSARCSPCRPQSWLAKARANNRHGKPWAAESQSPDRRRPTNEISRKPKKQRLRVHSRSMLSSGGAGRRHAKKKVLHNFVHLP